MGEIFAHDIIRDIEMDLVPVTDNEAAFYLQSGDLLFARQSLVLSGAGKSVIFLGTEPTVFESHLIRARPDKKTVDPKFLYYYFASPIGRQKIFSIVEQVAAAGIRGSDLANLELSLPPLPIQHQIAAILSAFDDKIELNQRMNRTLEQMARAMFKSWFIDFDPVRAKMRGEMPEGMDAETAALFPNEMEEVDGREVPRGWGYAPFDSRLVIFGGGTPKTSNPEFWGGQIPWYSVVDVPSDGNIWVLETEKTITDKGLESSSTRLLPVGTTIISARGTVGKVALTAVEIAMNQSCYGLFPRDGSSINFTYFSTLAAVEELKRRTHGAVFDTITRDTLKSVFAVVPPISVMAAFEERSSGWTQLILNHCHESARLAHLRDALLPRLLSGEMDVTEWGGQP
ncbi:restriction endonuclease subunit S [Deinococcus planocerae]|uniref:restriction endonuclease subunit S n=1 Tax=Deinococcus planocerae TaxID=1737569 RepID=UPI0015E13D6F|nr:restriction endonuclease subunit S [Deinococcus planocerae]